MTLTLSIDPEIEQRLREQAEAAGKEIDAYVSALVAQASGNCNAVSHTHQKSVREIIKEVLAQDTHEVTAEPVNFSNDNLYGEFLADGSPRPQLTTLLEELFATDPIPLPNTTSTYPREELYDDHY